jgi:hypothetical protein
MGGSPAPPGNRLDETGPGVRGWMGTSLPQEVCMAVEQSGAESSPGPEAPKEDVSEKAAAQPDLDEMKRKFREALERKRRTHASAEGADHTGKVHGSHGPAASRRSFRRKSG